MHPILVDPRRLVLYLLAWVPLAALLAALLVSGGSFSWTGAAAVVVPLDLGYAFVCLAAFYVCRAVPLPSASLSRIAITQSGAAVASAAIWLIVARAWTDFLADAGLVPSAAIGYTSAAPILLGRGILLFLLAAALHYLLAAFEASRHAETQALRFQILSRDADLRALRAQIHPHFLFNSLNSINALIASRPDEARRLCLLLADFLRRSLALGARERVSLSEELALAEDLLSIERVRFGSRLHYESRIDEAARECLVPPLLLQPLVENAVTHGIAQCLDGGTVRIEAVQRGDRLFVAIANARDAEAPARKGTGIGLDNVRRRLDALYGAAAGVRVRTEPRSFQVELELPATRAEV